MIFTASCASPLGGIVLAADEIGLTGLWFTGAKYFGAGLPASAAEADTPILAEARRWLEGYFTGQRPAALPPLHPSGSPFRRAVWDILLTIPYGETTTYGRIAQQLAAQRGLAHLSAQAVGGAVGHNPISILIPCHRVIGRQPDRLCRRRGKKARAPGIGARENLILFWGCRQERLHAVPMDNGLK